MGEKGFIPVTIPGLDIFQMLNLNFLDGVILPSSQGAQLVIETRNVKGILVEVFKIYNDNMW